MKFHYMDTYKHLCLYIYIYFPLTLNKKNNFINTLLEKLCANFYSYFKSVGT